MIEHGGRALLVFMRGAIEACACNCMPSTDADDGCGWGIWLTCHIGLRMGAGGSDGAATAFATARPNTAAAVDWSWVQSVRSAVDYGAATDDRAAAVDRSGCGG